jgi:hypothetical protein
MPHVGWDRGYTCQVICNQYELESLAFHTGGYWGGAHPYYATFYCIFDLGLGNRLLVSDLLIPGWEGELTRIGERKFREVTRIPDGKSVTEAGFDFPDSTFQLNSNFGIDSTGLFFYYNSYEIAGWAAGPSKVTLLWGEILHLIPPDTPLRRVAEGYIEKSR